MSTRRSEARQRPTPAAPKPSDAQAHDPADGISLQDLVLLKAPTPWQEAVAIVLEVIARRPRRTTFPAASSIVLTAAGEIRVSPESGSTAPPVGAAVALLHDLIGTANAAPALHQLIQENIGAVARCGTLDELATALGYFERPGRTRDIAAAYARTHALYVKAMAELELDRVRTKALRHHGGSSPAFGSVPPGWAQTALIAVVCIALLAASAALISMAVAPRPAPATIAEAPPATETTPATATATMGVIDTPAEATPALASDPAGPAEPLSDPPATEPSGYRNPGVAVVAVPRPAPRPVIVRQPAANATTPTPPSPEVAVPATPLPPVAAAPDPPAAENEPLNLAATEWLISIRDVTASVDVGPSADTAPPRPEAAALPLFTADDPDVAPPTLLRPQLPSRLISTTTVPHASTLEFIIGEDGRVERLRLNSVTNRLSEKMLLAAAKAWVFQPATRDGWPVRYRLRVQLVE